MGAGAAHTRPEGDSHDWAAVCRWEDAGRPPLPCEKPAEPESTDES